jgi:hypothetical protein
MKLIKENTEKHNYQISFKSHRTSKQPSVLINFMRELTIEEAKKINASVGKLVVFKPREEIPEDPKDIYLSKIYFYKVESFVLKYSILTKSQYELSKRGNDYKDKSDKDLFNIRPVTVDEIIKIIKREPFEDYGDLIADYIQYISLETNIKDLEKNKNRIEVKQKEKKSNQMFTGKSDKEPDEKEPDTKGFQKQKSIEKDSPKKIAAEIAYDYDLDKYINSIIKRYNEWKDPLSPTYGKDSAKVSFFDSLNKMLDLFDKFKTSDEVKEEIIVYLIGNRLQDKPGLFKLIKSEYDKRFKMNITESKRKIKEMSGTGGTGGSVAAPGSAHVTAGDSEGVATKYAFGGAGYDPEKKKKKKKRFKEVAEKMPNGNNKLVDRATKIYNIFKEKIMNLTLDKALKNMSEVESMYDKLEKSTEKIAELANKYQQSNPTTFKSLDEIETHMIKLDNILSDLISIYKKAQKNPIK